MIIQGEYIRCLDQDDFDLDIASAGMTFDC